MENTTLFVELTDEQLQKATGGKSACDHGCNGGHGHSQGNNCGHHHQHHCGHNQYGFSGGNNQYGFSGGNNCQSSCHHQLHPCQTSYCG
jgi:hypothetical protein